MIKILHRLAANKSIIKPFLNINHVQLYSNYKLNASTILRHSRFSQYMGLSQQLRKLQKEQQIEQKKQVRYSTIIIITSLMVFCSFLLFMTQDALIRLKLTVFLQRIKISFANKQQIKEQLFGQIISELQSFMKKYPYDNRNILPILKDLALSCQQISTSHLQQSLQSIYARIIHINPKLKSQKILLEGITAVAQKNVMKNKSVSQILLITLLQNGQIKQMYIALVCLKENKTLINQQMKAKIKQNLEKQHLLNSKYYTQDQIFPHISFKRLQLQKWKQCIEKTLNLYE